MGVLGLPLDITNTIAETGTTKVKKKTSDVLVFVQYNVCCTRHYSI